jgi:methylmalonyl-CoA mutase cobalamin-binding subunit
MIADDLASIGEVERRTGIAKETLRVWERRYGFPSPVRNIAGDRLYPPEQIEKLRVIKLLLDRGERPSKLVGRSLTGLKEALGAIGDPPRAFDPWIESVLERLWLHDVETLRGRLVAGIYDQGLERFVLDKAAPLTRAVGEAWMAGRLQVFEEHLFTEMLVRVLRGALERMPPGGSSGPKVLLTTLPGEPHALGLLMAECLMTLGGARCVSLGVDTPVEHVSVAAEAHDADIVALSFSVAYDADAAARGLAALRSRLPDGVEIWAGGGCPGLDGLARPGVRVVTGLESIRDLVSRWTPPARDRLDAVG